MILLSWSALLLVYGIIRLLQPLDKMNVFISLFYNTTWALKSEQMYIKYKLFAICLF